MPRAIFIIIYEDSFYKETIKLFAAITAGYRESKVTNGLY